MTVLIAGAGIGGLTMALSLHQIGVKARIFEAVPEVRPLGVGINVQPHAVRELEELGLLPALDATGLRTKEVAYYSSHGGLIWSEPRGRDAGYNWPQFSIHRGRLQMLLLEAVRERLGPEAIRTGTSVEAFRDSGDGIEVDLAEHRDGQTRPLGQAQGSLLIAADGIHSRARAILYPDEGKPAWGGTVMWRGVTSGPRFLTGRTMAMAGCKARKFVCYPIADETGADEDDGRATINWICDLQFPQDYLWNREDWNRPGKFEDFLPRFADWHFPWLDVPEIIRNASYVYEYPMVDRDPLPAWTRGRMTLMGDAAHSMYPIGSNGASQAILDARVLAREILAQGETPEALAAYEAERRPVTTKIVLANRADGPDKVLDIVEERAPHGFGQIDEVLSRDELAEAASAYKRIAGFDKDALNVRPPIVPAAAASAIPAERA